MAFSLGSLGANTITSNVLPAPAAKTEKVSRLQIVNGYWDLGSYCLILDPSDRSLTTASVSFIKRTGTFDARVIWHEDSTINSPDQIYALLTASPPVWRSLLSIRISLLPSMSILLDNVQRHCRKNTLNSCQALAVNFFWKMKPA